MISTIESPNHKPHGFCGVDPQAVERGRGHGRGLPAGVPTHLQDLRPGRLDQEKINRVEVVAGRTGLQSIPVGTLIAKPMRAGGGFDDLGRRVQDVHRVDDLADLVRHLKGGRWVLITLTVDRSQFIGPEAAYQRCNERVRVAMAEAVPSGIWFAGFEVQSKTGDGWPHWHVCAFVSRTDTRSVAAIKADVLRRWTTRVEHVNHETGEVERASVERIGFVDVSQARCPEAVGRYVAKYITKHWDAVPRWMLLQVRRFRKFRASPLCYEVLERIYRHERVRGGRREAVVRRRRPARPMLERVAESGSSLVVFKATPEGLRYHRTLPICLDDLGVVARLGGVVPDLGKALQNSRVTLSRAALTWLDANRSEFARRRLAYIEGRKRRLLSAWSAMQRSRGRARDEVAGGVRGVAGPDHRPGGDDGGQVRVVGGLGEGRREWDGVRASDLLAGRGSGPDQRPQAASVQSAAGVDVLGALVGGGSFGSAAHVLDASSPVASTGPMS